MGWEMKEGSGSLFTNDKKGNEKAPAYRGDIMLDGKVYELAGWIKQTKSGSNFLSLSGKPKEERQPQPSQGASVDNDIPFAPVGRHG